jgi:hypothetical protein
MATIYWVGGSGTWNTTSVTNWANSSGGTGGTGTVPTNSDNVIFDQAGTYTVTMTGALLCLNITVSAGTVTFATGTSPTLAVSGSMSIIAGTVWNSTGTITFNATTAKTISTNGITIDAPVTFNGVAGSWQLQSNFIIGSTRTMTLTNGTLNLNGFSLSAGLFSSSNSNTRTIAFGTGNITVNGTGSVWDTGTSTNLTVTGTPVVNVSNNTATAASVSAGSVSSNQISFNITSGTYTLTLSTITASSHINNLDFTGFSGSWSLIDPYIYGDLTFSSAMTLTQNTQIIFAGTSKTQNIKSNGNANLKSKFYFNGSGTTFKLLDSLSSIPTSGGEKTNLNNGTIDLNGFTMTVREFEVTGNLSKSISFNGGSLVITGGSNSVYNSNSATNYTFLDTGTISFTGTTQKRIYTGSNSHSLVTLNNGGSGQLYLGTSGTWKDITATYLPSSFMFYLNTTQTVSQLTLSGTAGNLVTLEWYDIDLPAFISKSSGIVACDYLYITGIQAIGGATFYAGSHSINGGEATGWIFSNAPTPVTATGKMFLAF